MLSTKLFTPPLRPNRMPRPRLDDRLDGGLDKTLTLVSAPAGYGKTTLVSSWLHKTHVPSTWISLDEGDNDPIRFLQYFISALQKVCPALQVDVLSALQGAQPGAIEQLLNLLINQAAGCTVPFVVVLDDFHAIHALPILEMIAYLLEHAPHQMHLALLSRVDPPLPLAHLRARNQLVEIRAEHLRFSRPEIACFFNEIERLDLSIEEVAAMETRTEGWIAGLQLAAVSMQDAEDVHHFVAAFTGSQYYIMDYLTEEVLKRQPERLRLFLLQTSILGHMCGALCGAVVDPGAIEPDGGQAMLEELERKNLFLVPLDAERRWYRYHHLFAEVLGQRLEYLYPHLPAELHRRASHWYEQNGFVPEAIQHALAAGDQERAIRLIEQHGILLLVHGEVTTLLKWIAAVEPHASTRPWFYIFKAWAYALTGNLERVDGMLGAAETLIAKQEHTAAVSVMDGAIAAARAHRANVQGDAHRAAEFARQALAYLPDTGLVSRSLRAVSTSLLGDASSLTGDLEQAYQAYLESARICQAAGDIHLTIVVNSNLANVLVEQGALHRAERIYSETLQLTTRPDGQKSVIAGRLFAELSQIYYEWNRLKEAGQYIRHSLALCQQWGNMDLQAVGHVMQARLAYIQCDVEKMHAEILAAEQVVNRCALAPRNATWVQSSLARLWIAQGELERAGEFVSRSGIDTTRRPTPGDGCHADLAEGMLPYLDEPACLVFLRLLLAQEEYARALALSQRLLRTAEPAGRVGRVIEVLALQALAYQGGKDPARAAAALEKALSLARPEGYVRLFLDEGEPMLRLLYQVKLGHPAAGGYAAQLLSAVDKTPAADLPPAQLLIEPLTAREIEILQLIGSGCNNQDIAGRLVISLPTVKRHISNIYAKLGAKSRTQAVSLGRDLDLLP